MATGSIQTILICGAAASSQAPCPEGMGVMTMQGYVVDASQAAGMEAQNVPFDYAYAAGIWSMAFTFVVALYLVSKSAGTILNAIRSL